MKPDLNFIENLRQIYFGIGNEMLFGFPVILVEL